MPYKNFKKTEIIDELGAELRRIRVEQHLTLVGLSAAIRTDDMHLSPTMLGRIENGERRIDDDLLSALCQALHADSDDVIEQACSSHIQHIIELSEQAERAAHLTELSEQTERATHLTELSEQTERCASDSFSPASTQDLRAITALYQSLSPARRADAKKMLRILAIMEV